MPDEPTAPPSANPPPGNANLTHPGGAIGKRARSKYELLVALRTNKGDRRAAAAQLDLTYETLCERIQADQQLRQLFSQNPTKEIPRAPGDLEVMNRTTGDLPLPEGTSEDDKNSVAGSLQLVSLVSPEDTKRLINGLKAFDFSEASLEKIKSLGKLAENTGRFIAVSLEKTHQNYVVQQFGLMELAADIRKRLMIPKGGEDYVSDEETRAFLHKNYVEMVRESGRGVERMLQVAEVITRMLESASSKTKNAQTKRGWKKVTAVEAQNGQAK